jgi:uncharacterized lipoprotein
MRVDKRKICEGTLAAIFICYLAGCSSSAPTTQPETISQRQDRALADPMDYQVPATPGPSSTNGNHNLKSDLNDVINP